MPGLILLGVLLVALPHAISLKPVQVAFKSALDVQYGIKADFDRIAWEWFPFPRVSLYQARLSHSRLDVSFPHGIVYPDIVGLIKWQSAGRMMLEQPVIVVKSLRPSANTEEKSGAVQKTPPPFFSLKIKDGHLLLPADGFLDKLAAQKTRTEITGINADVRFHHDGLMVKTDGRFSFADRILSQVSVKRQLQKETGVLKNYWRLDIDGENIDLTRARDIVLLLFGEHRVAQKVCDIVRGGRVKEGHYGFTGYAEDLNHLEAMKISALADDVSIRVPKIDLPIEHGRGSVVIENAILNGQGLAAGLGKSTGKNGSFRLGLGRDPVFQLAVDVDADLDELRGWLANNLLKHKETVVNELQKISSVKGRARGRLEIGDDLHHLAVNADILSSDGRIEYGRLQEPILFKRGDLTIYPDRLTWAGAQGQIGSQRIDDTSGTVFWKEKVVLDIDDIDARLDAGPLLKEVIAYPSARQILEPVIRSVSGPLQVKKVTVRGPITDISKLNYDATVSTDGLTIDSPLLPGEARVRVSDARISSKRIVLPSIPLDMSGERVTLEADFSHTLWKTFAGTLTVTGTVERQTAQWIRGKGWIPDMVFPRSPCQVKPLTIVFNGKDVSLNGTIVSGQGADSVTSRLDMNVAEGRVNLKKVIIASADEAAEVRLSLDRRRSPGLTVGFSGSLRKKSLDTILENNRFLNGKITGDCELAYDFSHASAHRFKGNLEASGSTFFIKDSRITINNTVVSGQDSFVEIKKADLNLNDEFVFVDGRVYFPDDAGIRTELNARSGYISVANLKRLSNDLKNLFKERDAASSSSSPSPSPASTTLSGMAATGTINFDVNIFQYNPESEPSTAQAIMDSTAREFTGHDLTGTINLMQPGNRVSVSINTGSICDAAISGMVGLPPEKTFLTFLTGAREKNDAQQLLDCLGIKDRKISGVYSLDVVIEGTPGSWTGGHIDFRVKDGTMKGMVILSKIFTLLNVTDLISLNVVKKFFTLGYPFSDIKVRGKIADNILTIDETKIIGEGLNIFFKGTIDLKTTAMDLVAYVTPFKTIDSIVTLIPYVGKKMGRGEKSVVFIPFKIRGTVKNPDVFLLYESKPKETPP